MSPVGSSEGLAAMAAGDTESRLAALRRLPPEAARRAAARELQVTFMTQLLAAMRRTVPKSDLLPESPTRNIYEGLFDRSMAEALTARDPLGLEQALGGPEPFKNPTRPADTTSGSHKAGKP